MIIVFFIINSIFAEKIDSLAETDPLMYLFSIPLYMLFIIYIIFICSEQLNIILEPDPILELEYLYSIENDRSVKIGLIDKYKLEHSFVRGTEIVFNYNGKERRYPLNYDNKTLKKLKANESLDLYSVKNNGYEYLFFKLNNKRILKRLINNLFF